LALRFDVRVFRKMYMKFGVEGAETMTPAEILDTPVTTPEGYDGIDMVMLYDSLAQDEVEEGVQTFFGSVELWQELGSPETLTRAHYETHIKAREARQQQNDELCDRIVDEQIARAHQASTPLEAVEMKRRVVLDFTVKEAAHDDSIDETRFGRIAAGYINAARQNYAAGNTEAGDKFTEKASEKAADPSCPPGERNKPGADKDKAPEGDHECNEVRDGDLVHCPYCDQNVRAIVPPPGEQIFCSNGQCEAAYVKSAKPKSGDVKSNSTAKFFQGLTPPKQKAKNDKT
jgi:hypothetical protein